MGLAKELIKAESGRFEPEKIPNKYAETLHELLQAKIEQRAPQIEVASEGKAPKEVINIMAALKQSMQAKGRAKGGMRCGSAWPSLRKRKSKGRELHDRGRTHAGRRIEAKLEGDINGRAEKMSVPVHSPRASARTLFPSSCG